jgi:hypothetical protein
VFDFVRIEKFFIENESFSSKTMSFLSLSEKDENLSMYSVT